MSEYIISTPSHMRIKNTSRRIMLDVLIALAPASVAGIVLFGVYSLALIAIAVATAVFTELIYLYIGKCCWRINFKTFLKQFWTQFDFTSVITGLLLALILPAGSPWYLPFLGSIFAVAVAKMLFGGTGKNIVNPAIAGRIFLFLSFTAAMTSYGASIFGPLLGFSGDIITGPTPLAGMLGSTEVPSVLDLFLGTGIRGCIGETCKAALLAGGIYLVVRKVIKWWWPCLYIGVTGLFTVVLNGFDFSYFFPSILSGGLILGAIFMATDYSTSPKSALGNVIYYSALGFLTAGLRMATGIEVVSFCIMLMNLIVPFLDTYLTRKPFGYVKKKEAVK